MNESKHNIDFQFLFLLVIISGLYIFWVWNHELAGFGGDNAVYLLTAAFYSPWTASSSIAEHFANHSQYPPFYPFLLAIFGGGKSILAAHLFTAVCLLLALVAMRIWLTAHGIASTTANLAVLLIAILPGTIKISMFILSENLYLLLSLSVLSLASFSEKKDNSLLLIMAAILVASATLTRTVGVSLAAAFCLYLALKKPTRSLLCGLIALAPLIIHTVFRKFQAMEHASYVDALVLHYSDDTLAKIIEQIQKESNFLWQGWLANFEAGMANIIIGLFLGLCLLSIVVRIYQRKLDGYYLLFYFTIILLWPYPAEAKRLIYVVLPIMVGQCLFFMNLIPSISLGKIYIRPVSVFTLAILIVSLPGTVLIIDRFLQPLPAELEPFRRNKFLYYSNHQIAHENLLYAKTLIVDLKILNTKLPQEATIYGIKPSIISLYSQRMTLLPPANLAADSSLKLSNDKVQPLYYYMMGITSPSHPKPYYPLEEITDQLEILHVAKSDSGDDAPVIAVLARLKQ
jgi:hypothetical protein